TLDVVLPSRVLVGFTGANGGLTDRHAVSNVSIAGGGIAQLDAGVDGSVSEAGPDAAPDAPVDAGVEAPDTRVVDAGVDAPADVRTDAPVDAGFEASSSVCTGVPVFATKDGWWLWTVGDRVQYGPAGARKLYSCTNIGFCNDPPD